MAAKRSLLIILVVSLLVLVGCGSSSSEKVPDDVKKARDKALKAAQETAHEVEGGWVDRIANLENYSQNADAMDTAEYVSLRNDLLDYAKEYKAKRLYVMAIGEDSEFLLVVDTNEKGSSWHQSMPVDAEACSKASADGLISAEHKGFKSGDKYYWSAYAPLYNQNGEIAYVLGADISSKKLADYPDWISEKGGE